MHYEAQSLFFSKCSCSVCVCFGSPCINLTIFVINNVRVFFCLIFLKCYILVTLAQITFTFIGLLLYSLGAISTNFCGKILKIEHFLAFFPVYVFFWSPCSLFGMNLPFKRYMTWHYSMNWVFWYSCGAHIPGSKFKGRFREIP